MRKISVIRRITVNFFPHAVLQKITFVKEH